MLVSDLRINSGVDFIVEEKVQANRLRNLVSKLEKNAFKRNIDEEDKSVVLTLFDKLKKISLELESIHIKSEMSANREAKLKNRYKDLLLFIKMNNQTLYKYRMNLTIAGLVYIIYSYVYANIDNSLNESEVIDKVINQQTQEREEKAQSEAQSKETESFKKTVDVVNVKKRKAFLGKVYLSLNTTGIVIPNSLTAFISLFREQNQMFNETVVILKKLGLK